MGLDSPSEASIVKSTLKALNKQFPGWWVKIHGSIFQKKGMPDIIGLCQGVCFGFEMKVPGEEDTLTPTQEYHLRQIKEHGGVAEMATSKQQVLKRVRKELKKK